MTLLLCLTLLSLSARAESNPSPATPDNRVASFFISQDFINAQIAAHSKSQLIKDLKIKLDPDHGQIFLNGLLQVPTEELRAINLDPKLGAFRFQLTIKPETSKKGFLILEFPFNETYFYPAESKDLEHDRVIVPVQMLSLALASVRGYLAALSGDFSGFDRRTTKLKAQIKALDGLIVKEQNEDARDAFRDQRTSLKLQLQAVPIERKQLLGLSKEVGHMLGFTGEKELHLNEELGARRNALIFKVQLSQLAPYLSGVELGGVRIIHNKRENDPQNYLAVDVNSVLGNALPPLLKQVPSKRPNSRVSPSLVVRLNQSLLESAAVLGAEKKAMGSNLKDLTMDLKDDGLHVAGKWHKFFLSVPFDTVVDFVTTDVDTFEVRVRTLDVAGLDLEFLTKFVLQAMQARLENAMKGICHFKYVGEESDHSRALQVSVDPTHLIPAFPELHLVGVDIREREFLLKIGQP